MKKLGKLAINPEKLMTDGELVTLKGGYGADCGDGFYTVNCILQACSGCAYTYDPACVPSEVILYNQWVSDQLFLTYGFWFEHVECNL